MTKTRLAYVTAVTLALVACGDDDGGSLAVADVPERLEGEVCAQAVACGLSPDEATCRATTFLDTDSNDLEAAVARGTVIYDAGAAADCIDAFADFLGGCAFSDQGSIDEPPDACARAVQGTVAAGGACYLDEECVGGSAGDAECVAPPSCTMACCMGTCSAVDEGPPLPCTIEDLCADGLYCQPGQTMDTCQPQVSSGACDAFDACASPMICDLDFGTGMGTCYRPAAEGATCNPEALYASCDRFDNYCDPADSTCKKRPRPGEACNVEVDNCAEWAWCNAGTCDTLPGEGEPCPQQLCLGDLDCTEAGSCVAPAPDPPCPGS
jgi:hypothetical protein